MANHLVEQRELPSGDVKENIGFTDSTQYGLRRYANKSVKNRNFIVSGVCRLGKTRSGEEIFFSFDSSWSIRLARTKANDLGGPSRLLRMAVSQFWGGRDLCLSSF